MAGTAGHLRIEREKSKIEMRIETNRRKPHGAER